MSGGIHRQGAEHALRTPGFHQLPGPLDEGRRLGSGDEESGPGPGLLGGLGGRLARQPHFGLEHGLFELGFAFGGISPNLNCHAVHGHTARSNGNCEDLTPADCRTAGTREGFGLTGMQLERNEHGAFVVSHVRSGSGAERIGVQPGDLLLGINGKVLEDDQALRRQVLTLRGQSRAFILVQRGAGRYHVAIPLT